MDDITEASADDNPEEFSTEASGTDEQPADVADVASEEQIQGLDQVEESETEVTYSEGIEAVMEANDAIAQTLIAETELPVVLVAELTPPIEGDSRFRNTSTNTEVEDFVRQLQITNIELSSRLDIVSAEKRDLLEQLQRRLVEYDQLKADHAEMVRERAEAQRMRIEIQVQLDESRAEESTRRFREERMQSELRELQKQVGWLDEQLSAKQNEIYQARKENVEKLQETALEATRSRARCAELERELTEARSVAEQKDTAAKRHADTVRELRESFDTLDGKYSRELDAQTRLATLYKEANEDSELRCGELSRAVSELQQLVREASGELLRVETAKRAEVERAEAAVSEKDAQLEEVRAANAQITEQLDEAKRELEMIRLRRKRVPLLGLGAESDTPMQDAATSSGDPQELSFAARFLAQRGLTFTQLFNEYVDVCEAFEDERAESARLRNTLSELETDVRAKEPIYRRQRDELVRALDALTTLTQRVEVQATDALELQRRNDELLRKQSSWRDDIERYQQRCADLAEQVRTLLIQLEGRSEMREDSRSEDMRSDAAESEAQAVIRNRLVTFRSVSELQTRNEELLVLVRTLTEKRERDERDELTSTTRELREHIDSLEAQLLELRTVREEQTNAIDALVEQREMYKSLFVQFARTGANLPLGGPDSQPSFTALLAAVQQLVEQHITARSDSAPTPPPAPPAPQPSEALLQELDAARRSAADLENRLADAREKLARVTDELETAKRALQDRDSTQRNELDEARRQLQDARYQNARVQSQCELAMERCKLLQSTLDSYKKEIETLRESNQLYTKLVGDHEKSIGTMKQELLNANERAVRAEVQLTMTREQLMIVKQSEQRLSEELESARQAQHSHKLVLNNIQALQNRLDIDDWDTKARLDSQIKLYEAECTELRKRLQEERDTHDTLMRSLERERNEARTLHETERVEHDATRRKLEEAEDLVRRIRGRIQSVEADRRDMNVSTRDEPDSADDTESHDVVVELERVSSEAQRLRVTLSSNESQLETARRNIGEFKKLVGTLEKSLSEQITAHRTVCESLNERLVNETQRANNAEREQQRLGQELATLRAQSETEHRESAAQLDALRSEASIAAKRNADLETRLKQVDSLSTESHADLEMRAQLAHEYRTKFETEAAEHSRDVQLLVDTKRKLEEAELALVRRSHEFDTRCILLENERETLKQSETRLRADLTRLEALMNDAQAENRVLFERFDTLNAKLAYHESRQRDPLAGLPSTSAFLTPSTPAASTLVSAGEKQLTELVKLVRREKEIATTQCELVRAEADRFRVRAEMAEKQVESLRGNINELQTRLAESIEKSAQHAQLTSKLEQLSVFQESNRVLREEKERLVARVRELESSATKCEQQLNEARSRFGEAQRSAELIQVERDVLQKEVSNLRQRVSALSEQVAQHASFANDIGRLRTENESLQTQFTALHTQISSLNTQLETAIKNEAIVKKMVDEKENMIVQLKTIGRKYKTESQTARNQVDELQARIKSLESAQVETDASRSQRGQLEAELTRLQEELRRANATYQNELNTARNELNNIKRQKAEADEANVRGTTQCRQANEKVAALQAELNQLRTAQTQPSASLPRTPAESDERVRRLELELNRNKQLKTRLVDEYEQKIKELQAEIAELRRQLGLTQATQSESVTLVQSQEAVPEEAASSQASSNVHPDSDAQVQVQPSAQPPAAAVKPVVSAVRPTVQPVAASPIPVAPLLQAASRQTASIRPMPVSTGVVTQTSSSVITSQATTSTMTVTATVVPLQPSAVVQSTGLDVSAGPSESVSTSSDSTETATTATSLATTSRVRRGLIRATASGVQQPQPPRARPALPVSSVLVLGPQTEASAESSNAQSAAPVSHRSPTSAPQPAALEAAQRSASGMQLRVKRNAAAAQLAETQQSAVSSAPLTATATAIPPQVAGPSTSEQDDEASHALAPKRTRRDEEELAQQPSGIQVHAVAPQPHLVSSELQPASESAMQTDQAASVAQTNEAQMIGSADSNTMPFEPESAGPINLSIPHSDIAMGSGGLQSDVAFHHEEVEPASSSSMPVESGELQAEGAEEMFSDVAGNTAELQPAESDALVHTRAPQDNTEQLGRTVEHGAPGYEAGHSAEQDDRSSDGSSVIMLSSGSEDEGEEEEAEEGASDNQQYGEEEEQEDDGAEEGYEQSGDENEEYEDEQLEEGEAVEQQSDDHATESGDEAVSEEDDHEQDAGDDNVPENVDVQELSGDTVVEAESPQAAASEHASEGEGSADQEEQDAPGSAEENDEEQEEMDDPEEQEDAVEDDDATQQVECEDTEPEHATGAEDEPTTVPKNPLEAQTSASASGFAIEMESEMSEFADEERAAEQQNVSSAGATQLATAPSSTPFSATAVAHETQASAQTPHAQQRATAAQLSDLEKRSLRFGGNIPQTQPAAVTPAPAAPLGNVQQLQQQPQQPQQQPQQRQPGNVRARMTGQPQRAQQPGGVGGMPFRGGPANQYRWSPQNTRQMAPTGTPEGGLFRPRAVQAQNTAVTSNVNLSMPGAGPMPMMQRGAMLQQQGSNMPRFGGPPTLTGMQQMQMPGSTGQPAVGMPIQQLASNPFTLRRAAPQMGSHRAASPFPRGPAPPRGGPGPSM